MSKRKYENPVGGHAATSPIQKPAKISSQEEGFSAYPAHSGNENK